jgi:hypothetical protein
MANSELQGKYWEIDDEMNNHLSRIYNAYRGDKTVKGYSRLEGLLNNRECSYEQMKRVKNFFDTFDGSNKDTSYLLNGGTKMKNWVDVCLGNARQDIKGKKKSMMNIGMDNQFQKDGGTKDQDSSGKRIRTDNISVNETIYEVKAFSNLLNVFEENNKKIKNL